MIFFFGFGPGFGLSISKLKLAPASDNTSQLGLRSIRNIIADLSKPPAKEWLKTRTEERRNKKTGQVTKIRLPYLPWYQAVRYLDHYAPGWSYDIRSVVQMASVAWRRSVSQSHAPKGSSTAKRPVPIKNSTRP